MRTSKKTTTKTSDCSAKASASRTKDSASKTCGSKKCRKTKDCK